MRFEIAEDLPVPVMRHDTPEGGTIYLSDTLPLDIALRLASRLVPADKLVTEAVQGAA